MSRSSKLMQKWSEKISLDNLEKMRYHMKKTPMKLTAEDQDRVELTQTLMTRMGQAIRETKTDLGLLIAGGIVRDLRFSSYVNDLDVFVDTSTVPEDERDDATLLAADKVLSKFWELFPDYDFYTKTLYKREPGEYNDQTSQGQYHVYNSVDFCIRLLNEPLPDGLRPTAMPAPTVQFIGRPSPEITMDHEALVQSFDYELVKCWYNPYDDSIHYTEEFEKAYKKGVVTSDNDKTSRRINRWLGRDNRLRKHITVNETYTKSRLTFDAKLNSYARAYGTHLIQEERPLAFPNAQGQFQVNDAFAGGLQDIRQVRILDNF